MPELIVPGGLVCGIDEAGRGPLAGPVVAAAVILDPARPIAGLNDSKKLSERKRVALADLIRQNALAWCVAEASVEEIDRLNILQATLLAMQRAVAGLSVRPKVRWLTAIVVPASIFRSKPWSRGMARLHRSRLPPFWPRPSAMPGCSPCTRSIHSTVSIGTWVTRLLPIVPRCKRMARRRCIARASGRSLSNFR